MWIFWQFSVDNTNQKRTVAAITKEITIYSFEMVESKNDQIKETSVNNGNKGQILFSAGSLEGSYINKIWTLSNYVGFSFALSASIWHY